MTPRQPAPLSRPHARAPLRRWNAQRSARVPLSTNLFEQVLQHGHPCLPSDISLRLPGAKKHTSPHTTDGTQIATCAAASNLKHLIRLILDVAANCDVRWDGPRWNSFR